jgi:hypothetical protein
VQNSSTKTFIAARYGILPSNLNGGLEQNADTSYHRPAKPCNRIALDSRSTKSGKKVIRRRAAISTIRNDFGPLLFNVSFKNSRCGLAEKQIQPAGLYL